MNYFILCAFFVLIFYGCSVKPVEDVHDNVSVQDSQNNDNDNDNDLASIQKTTQSNDNDLTSEHQPNNTISNDAENATTEKASVALQENEQETKLEENGEFENESKVETSKNKNSTPPNLSSIEIESSEFTSKMLVNLFLEAVGATEMYITNDPSCTSGGNWEPYTTTKDNWALAEINVLTSVYVKYKDEVGDVSSCISDSITHDESPPSKPAGIDDRFYTNKASDSPVMSWEKSMDTKSPIDYYELSLGFAPGDDSIKPWTNVGNVSTASLKNLTLAQGINYFANVRAVDLAGNFGDFASSDGFFYNYCYSINNDDSWIFIPGDLDYNTNDFCVMKYEAKNKAGTPVSKSVGLPWTNIDQSNAISKCESLGSGFHLLTNPEWMTIAANMSNVASNWSGASVGSGAIFVGHSDADPENPCEADADDSKAYVENNCTGLTPSGDTASQKRTLKISTGGVIWDLSGNVSEWINLFRNKGKPSPQKNEYYDFTEPIIGSPELPLTELIPSNAVKTFWIDSWNSKQGIGMARIGKEKKGGGLTRGGGYSAGDKRNGIFRLRLDQDPNTKSTTLGFRCTFDIP